MQGVTDIDELTQKLDESLALDEECDDQREPTEEEMQILLDQQTAIVRKVGSITELAAIFDTTDYARWDTATSAPTFEFVDNDRLVAYNDMLTKAQEAKLWHKEHDTLTLGHAKALFFEHFAAISNLFWPVDGHGGFFGVSSAMTTSALVGAKDELWWKEHPDVLCYHAWRVLTLSLESVKIIVGMGLTDIEAEAVDVSSYTALERAFATPLADGRLHEFFGQCIEAVPIANSDNDQCRLSRSQRSVLRGMLSNGELSFVHVSS